ncbi:hypothetical protein [Xanthocytophaga agilis]|uniref:Arabinogalactan endo-beta-1,4-galactanase n=1 Tax=Xanthocytophaga agilis TaxID=3048010 RepID=A0AAE3RDL9_9BACT|nr:hypothetical protein [Xanthocytophaga agilis]MDJ1505823.1 hypothetical protein [Xanthocytophaga agilis]
MVKHSFSKILWAVGWGVISILTLAQTGCEKKENLNPQDRTYYMGFTPLPYALTPAAIDYTYTQLEQSADIVCHHFDDGVPWVEALKDTAFHPGLQQDWAYRKSRTLPSQKVFLAFTPIRFDRVALASYRAATPNMDMPSPWNTYSFNHPDVKKAYLTYCKRGIDFFNPHYFLMGIEVNLLLKLNPSLWQDYLELHTYVYQQLKKAYPDLPVAVSVSGIDLLEGYTDADHAQQTEGLTQILQQTDFLGFSLYSYQTRYLTGDLPTDMFSQLFSLTSKPIAITETGYPAQRFSVFTNSITFEGTEDKQDRYISQLLTASNHENMLFVINFVLRDYDQLWQAWGSKDDITILWRDTGLIDENASPRKGFQTWKSYLKIPKK